MGPGRPQNRRRPPRHAGHSWDPFRAQAAATGLAPAVLLVAAALVRFFFGEKVDQSTREDFSAVGN